LNPILKWKDELPPTWEILPLKAVASYKVSSVDKLTKVDEIPVELCNYTDVYNNDFISNDLDFMKATATEDEVEKYKLEIGDILITKDSESWDDMAIPSLVQETKDNLLCGYHLAIIRPNTTKILPAFLLYCLQSKAIRIQLELASTGVTRYGLPKDEIGRASLPLPALGLQRRITDYLSHELAEIDQTIAAKSELLRLLAQKRQAIITNALTAGLTYSFSEKKIKYLTSKIGSGITPKGGALVYQKSGVPLLRSQNIQFEGLDLQEVAYIPPEIHESMSNSKVLPGDVLLNITGASIGRCYYYEGQLGEANVNQHVCILRPNDQVLTKYLYLLLFSEIGQNQVTLHQVGGGREGLTFESIKSFIFPVPNIRDQATILQTVQKSLAKILQLEKATGKSVELLTERRSTLVTAAITGQLPLPS
jgi:type I restriction enzyme, S subunit